jgi:hypothetical protein
MRSISRSSDGQKVSWLEMQFAIIQLPNYPIKQRLDLLRFIGKANPYLRHPKQYHLVFNNWHSIRQSAALFG